MLTKDSISKMYIKISFEEEKIVIKYENLKFLLDQNGKFTEECKEKFLKFIFEVEQETEILIENNSTTKIDNSISFKLDKVKEWLNNFIEGLKNENKTDSLI